MSKHKDLTDFIALVKKDGLMTSSHFDVNIFMPKAFDHDDLYDQTNARYIYGRGMFNQFSKLSMLCDSASIPGVMFLDQYIEMYGEQRKMPTIRQFNDITLTFICDIDLVSRRFFESWMEYVIDPVTRTVGYYDNYTTTMTIGINDGASEDYNSGLPAPRKSNRRMTMTLFECFPKNLHDIVLNYDNPEFAKVTVDMSYKYHMMSVGE